MDHPMSKRGGVVGFLWPGRGDYPCVIPLKVHKVVLGGVDDYGDPVDAVSRVVDIKVFAVVEGGQDVPDGLYPERVQFDLTVYAPADAGITTEDRLEWAGGLFEVAGPVQNWDHNPWWQPGLSVVNCRRVDL